MTELLTAKDVEVRVFKKVSFGGYSVPEVEEFLNQVADDLETYAVRLNERDNRIHELEEYVKKQESMADMIKNAIIEAQKAAEGMEEQARVQQEKILADARVEAEKTAAEIIEQAKANAENIRRESQDREKRWSDLEQDIARRRQEASAQAEQTIANASTEARRILDEAAGQVEERREQLRFLNLQKQQFLKDTISLILEFGRELDEFGTIVAKARQEAGNEGDNNNPGLQENGNGERDERDEREREQAGTVFAPEHQDAASQKVIERFRRNLFEGRPAETEPDAGA